MEKAKIIYNKICNIVQTAVYSDVYTLCVCIFAYLMWLFDCSVAALAVVIVLASVTLLFTNDLSALFLPIVVSMVCVRHFSESEAISLWPCLILFLSGCVVFFLRNFKHKPKLDKMFFAQIAVSVALLMGGVGAISSQNYLRALPLVLALSLGVLAIYFFFVNLMKESNGVDIPLHFAKVFAFVGVVVCLQLLTLIIQAGNFTSGWTDIYWDVGWGNRNMIATFINFSMIACLYLCIRAKKFPFVCMLLAFFHALCLVLSMSRGGIVFGAIAFVVGLVMAIIKGNRKQLLICLGAVVAAALLMCAVFHQKVSEMLSSVWDRLSQISIRIEDGKLVIEGTSGRFGEDGLYGKAWQLFKQYPIFGAGIGHVTVADDVTISKMDWFHSTVLEIFASMGIVGVLCYGFYYFVRLFTVFEKKNIKNRFPLFVFISWIAFEGQSLVDVGLLEPVYIIFIAIQMAIMQVCKEQRYEEPVSLICLWRPISERGSDNCESAEKSDEPEKSSQTISN